MYGDSMDLDGWGGAMFSGNLHDAYNNFSGLAWQVVGVSVAGMFLPLVLLEIELRRSFQV